MLTLRVIAPSLRPIRGRWERNVHGHHDDQDDHDDDNDRSCNNSNPSTWHENNLRVNSGRDKPCRVIQPQVTLAFS